MNTLNAAHTPIRWLNFCLHITGAVLLLLLSFCLIALWPHNAACFALAALLGAGCTAYIIKLAQTDVWVVKGQKLYVSSLWGSIKKETPLSDITSWSETPVKTIFGNWFILKVYTAHDNYRLVSYWYNYYPVRGLLCRDLMRRD